MLYDDLIKSNGNMARLEKIYELLIEYYTIKGKTASYPKEYLDKADKLKFITPQKDMNNFISSIIPILLDNNVTLASFLEESNIKKLSDSEFYLDYIEFVINGADDKGRIQNIYSVDKITPIKINDGYYSNNYFIDFIKNIDNENIIPLLSELQFIENIDDGLLLLNEYKNLMNSLKSSHWEHYQKINNKSFTSLFISHHALNRGIKADNISGMKEYYQYFNFLNGVDNVPEAFITFRKNKRRGDELFNVLFYTYETNYKIYGSSLFFKEGDVYDKLCDSITTEEFINFYSEDMPIEWTFELYINKSEDEND